MKEEKRNMQVRDVINNACLVNTGEGSFLVHCPPETLKHLFALGLEVPKTILLPPDIEAGKQLGSAGFVRQGINYASVEFFLYYNFFISGGNKTKILTITRGQSERMQKILHEVLLGPFHKLPDNEYDWLEQECLAVAHYPGLGRAPVVEDVAEFHWLEEGGCEIDGVHISFEHNEYVFTAKDGEELIVSSAINDVVAPLTLAPPRPLLRQKITLQFIGSSDGFDPNGITTCFLAYIGSADSSEHRPILFDAAAYLRARLGNLGISLNQISEVFLTHMHEDHMAGLPELLLMGESRIRIITSDPIYGSLLRMLSAILNVPEEEASALFDFIPLNPNEPKTIAGRRFETIYAVHSIPTLAVRVEGLCYSGDMRYDEEWFTQLVADNVISENRRKEVINFANDAEVLIQDVGGGSIHTTLTSEVFQSLAAKSRHLILTHTSKPNLPQGASLQDDEFSTVEFASDGSVTAIGEKVHTERGAERFETITATPLFARLPLPRRRHLAENAHLTKWSAGENIMNLGEPSDGHTYIVHKGLVEVRVKNRLILVIGRGSSVGERGALRQGEVRTATVVARGDVEMLSIDPDTFRGVADELRLEEAFKRADWLWRHPKFGHLSWATLLDLALDFEPRHFEAGECLYKQGELGQECYLLISGEIELHNNESDDFDLVHIQGEFLGGRTVLFSELHPRTACAVGSTEVWALPMEALQRLKMVYPNMVLQLRTGEKW